jgi:hypothetical protein
MMRRGGLNCLIWFRIQADSQFGFDCCSLSDGPSAVVDVCCGFGSSASFGGLGCFSDDEEAILETQFDAEDNLFMSSPPSDG